MATRQRILLDVDGVLADFVSSALQVIERVTGKKPVPEVHHDWDMFKPYPKDVEDAFYREFKREGWCINLPVYPGARAGVDLLREYADVYYVTSPMSNAPYWAHERTLWLIRHFAANDRQVVHTNAKYVCVGDILVDDKIEHLQQWERHHPNGIPVLWDQPYNRKNTSYQRARTWQDVLTHLKR